MNRGRIGDGGSRRTQGGRWPLAALGILSIGTIAPFLLAPDPVPMLTFVLSLTTSLVLMVRASRGLLPWHRREWLLILWGAVIWAVAIILVAIFGTAPNQVINWRFAAFTSPIGYIMVGLGVVGMVRKEGLARDSAVWLDSAIGVLSVLASWWLLVGEEAFSAGITGMALVANLYPLGDALLLAAALALLSSRSQGRRSSLALLAALLQAILADIVFGAFAVGRLLPSEAMIAPALWMAEFGMIAVAVTLAHRDEEPGTASLSPVSILVEAVCVLCPGLIMAVGWLTLHRPPRPGAVLLVTCATVVMAALQVARMLSLLHRIERQSQELARTARTDELTGLPNRRAGSRLLQEEIDRALATGAGLHVAMLDIDHFKAFNDTFGHLQGDKLLRAAGLRWRTALADQGHIYRYGGEEFVVILPGDDATRAQETLAALRRTTPKGQTFSAGLAALHTGDVPESILGRADGSLYEAKHAGRDRVVASA